MRIFLSSWPSRVFTLPAGNLNSGVGRFRDGTHAEGQSLGEFHLGAQMRRETTSLKWQCRWSWGYWTRCGSQEDLRIVDWGATTAPLTLSWYRCLARVAYRRSSLAGIWVASSYWSCLHTHVITFPVLFLLSPRMRRVGQDQQRAHRWDFDRMAIALQQG